MEEEPVPVTTHFRSPFQSQLAQVQTQSQPRAIMSLFQSNSQSQMQPGRGIFANAVRADAQPILRAAEDITAKVDREISVAEVAEETALPAGEAVGARHAAVFGDKADCGPFAAFGVNTEHNPYAEPLVAGILPMQPPEVLAKS